MWDIPIILLPFPTCAVRTSFSLFFYFLFFPNTLQIKYSNVSCANAKKWVIWGLENFSMALKKLILFWKISYWKKVVLSACINLLLYQNKKIKIINKRIISRN